MFVCLFVCLLVLCCVVWDLFYDMKMNGEREKFEWYNYYIYYAFLVDVLEGVVCVSDGVKM